MLNGVDDMQSPPPVLQTNAGRKKFNPLRWAMIVALGGVLGWLYIYWNLSMVMPDSYYGDGPAPRVQRRIPDFRLSVQEVRAELVRVIDAQLVAFRKNDYPKAYHFAASNVREQISLPAFERMVRRSYPAIARSLSAQYGMAVDNGEEALVTVGVRGQAGRTRQYQYLLRLEPSGWRIDSVVHVNQPMIML